MEERTIEVGKNVLVTETCLDGSFYLFLNGEWFFTVDVPERAESELSIIVNNLEELKKLNAIDRVKKVIELRNN